MQSTADPYNANVDPYTADSYITDAGLYVPHTPTTMLAPTGREIPNPPLDPVARREWSKLYFAELYGSSPEQLKTILNLPHLEYLAKKKLQRKRRWIVFLVVLTLVTILLSTQL